MTIKSIIPTKIKILTAIGILLATQLACGYLLAPKPTGFSWPATHSPAPTSTANNNATQPTGLPTGFSWPATHSPVPTNTTLPPATATNTALPTYTQPPATSTIEAVVGCMGSYVIPESRFDGKDGDDYEQLKSSLYSVLPIKSSDKLTRVIFDPNYNTIEYLINGPDGQSGRATVSQAEMDYLISMTAGPNKEILWYTRACMEQALDSNGGSIDGLADLLVGSYDAKSQGLTSQTIGDYLIKGDLITLQPNAWNNAPTDPPVVTIVNPYDPNGKPLQILITTSSGTPDETLFDWVQSYFGIPPQN